VPSHAQTLQARMHVFATFDEEGLSSLRVNGYGISNSSSSDMDCVLQLVQAAAMHTRPILRMQRSLISHAPQPPPPSSDTFASALFASVSGAAAAALLTAAPHLPPRELCVHARYVRSAQFRNTLTMYARLHSLREESVKTVRPLPRRCTYPYPLHTPTPQFSLSHTHRVQVSQVESSGAGSSGRALFDDVIAGVTLQQLQVPPVCFLF
jgi:hypothetical protein